jgi:hypothetical protein
MPYTKIAMAALLTTPVISQITPLQNDVRLSFHRYTGHHCKPKAEIGHGTNNMVMGRCEGFHENDPPFHSWSVSFFNPSDTPESVYCTPHFYTDHECSTKPLSKGTTISLPSQIFSMLIATTSAKHPGTYV